ncbi:hypothetical protein K523DRAFT_370484 [Schizophyllum commune Tattone D]|nr:hypothetical protein K523DRAFT_370484 [Schizophyllum commune Tattone D]
MNRLSTTACKERASSNGSINSVDAIDKRTLDWIEAGLPRLSCNDLKTVLVRFFRDQDGGKMISGTAPAKSANTSATALGIARNAQAQGRNPPVYPPPTTTHTQRGGSSYYRAATAPQPGHLSAGQMPTFTYTPPAFAQVAMPPPSQYTRVGAQNSTTSSAQGRPSPPTWAGAPKAPTDLPRPPIGATRPPAGGSKSAAGAPRSAAGAKRSTQPAPRMSTASRSSKRKDRSGSLERVSMQRSSKRATQAPPPSEAWLRMSGVVEALHMHSLNSSPCSVRLLAL